MALTLAIAMAGMAFGGYFLGMSEGLKKDKSSDVKTELIIAAVALIVGIGASVQVEKQLGLF